MVKKILSWVLVISFCFQQTSFAQMALELNLASHFAKTQPAIITDVFRPVHLRYFSYDTLHNKFNIMLDKGDSKKLSTQELQNTGKDLLSYFLVGVTLPNEAFWVNLRPDAEDQVIDDLLARTDVGKIMLEADLQLKKDTSLYTSPQTTQGKEYWKRLYKKAEELFGSDNINIPTLTRPWIVPGEIIVRESKDGSAYIYKATLKVMLEQDHLKNSATYSFNDPRQKELNEYSSQLIRELIIPNLTKEVNSSKKYAELRQVFYSLILSRWFKSRFVGKAGTYAELINKKDLTNLSSKTNWSKLTYISAYKKSFAEGEYNIKEPVTTPSGQVIRSYFSGGLGLTSILPGDASSPIKDPINAVTFAGSSPVVGSGFGKDMFSISGTPDGVVSSAVVASSPQFTRLDNGKVPPFFASILGDVGLNPEAVEVLRLKGDMPVDEVLNQPYTRQVVETSIGQAIGSRLFAGIGAKRGKGVADANAVEFSRRSIMSFIMRNQKEAVVVMADEGERDDSVSLKRGRIYSSIYETGYWDPDAENFKESLADEIMRLRKSGIKISYFAGDALEHTNGLIMPRAYIKATNSWSLAALFDDLKDGIRRTVWDRFRIAGISFDAPDSANVQPLDLPSVATRKIAVVLARQQGIKEKDPKFMEFYANYMNHLAILTLGSRKKNLAKEALQSGDSRHARIIDDVKKLQRTYPGLKLFTPGDGDFAPRVIASLGLDIGNGYKMMVFGRSGAAEASIAKLVSALVEGAQFSNRFVSETNTALDVSEVTAVNFTGEDKEMYEKLGYDADVYTRTYNRFDFRGKGTFAMTAVTGASEDFFGPELAGLLQRVNVDEDEGLFVTNTLTVTSDGSVFVIRTHFKSQDMAETQDGILTASPEAAQFVKDQIDSSKEGRKTASSAVMSEKEQEELLSRISAIDTKLANVWAELPAGTLQYEDVAFNSVIAFSHIINVLKQEEVSRDKVVEAISKELELLKKQIEKLKAYNGKHVMLFLEKAVMNHYRVIEAEFNNLISSLQGQGVSGSSSALQKTPDALGGIDFRVMDIKYQAMGSFAKLDLTLPKLSRVELQSIDLDKEILSIQRMANSSIEPSAKRLEEVLAACVQKGELNQRREALASCAMDICEIQEMRATESSPELRRIIVLLDQLSSKP